MSIQTSQVGTQRISSALTLLHYRQVCYLLRRHVCDVRCNVQAHCSKFSLISQIIVRLHEADTATPAQTDMHVDKAVHMMLATLAGNAW